jgi:ABC-2 type transport system ATP-binding protein
VPTPTLAFEHVRREYAGVVALSDLDLEVEAGRGLVLVGRNGSGKTTTLQLAAGRLDPSDGVVRVNGRDTTSRDGRDHLRSAVGFALDLPVFYPDLTVEEHLGLVATAYGVEDGDARIVDLLERFDLARRAGFLADQLSSGMRQKLQLACLLVRPARLLLLDEPSRALDPATRELLWSALAQRKRAGASIVFSTHQLDFPADLADHALVLRDGEVLDRGRYGRVMGGAAVAALGLA